MTNEEVQALKPGENLYWVGKGSDPLSAVNVFGKSHGLGNPVSFVKLTSDVDSRDKPIIIVSTEHGEHRFSSDWFEKDQSKVVRSEW